VPGFVVAGPEFFEKFSEKFLENIFGAGKNFRKKFCADSLNYFLLRGKGGGETGP
jgi:hypothetical protein